MEFEYPWALVGVPFILFFFAIFIWLVRVKEQVKRWQNIEHAVVGSARKKVGKRRSLQRYYFLMCLGLILLVLALARPKWGEEEQISYQPARDVMIAMDLSKSMLAQDVTPSRLDRAKLMVQELFGALQGERVGLLVFAGTAFVQSPLSGDYEILREIVPTLSPSFLPEGGTDYEAMLMEATRGFSVDVPADRYLIVLSDGENLSDDWASVMETIKYYGIRIITLGIGTLKGGVIHLEDGGVQKDESGQVILSKLEERVLMDMAEESGGIYKRADRWVDIHDEVKALIAKGKKFAAEEKRTASMIERFQYFLAPGVVLLLMSLLFEFPKYPSNSEKMKRKLMEKDLQVVTLVVLLGYLPVIGFAQLSGGGQPLEQLIPAANERQADPQQAQASEQLRHAVTHLFQQDKPLGKDWAHMAQATLSYGQAMQGGNPAVIEDGLKAVSEGRSTDSKAADWDTLESQLRDLLNQQEQEQQQKDQNSEQQEENQSEDSSNDSQNQQQDPQQNQEQDQNQESQTNGEQQQNQNPEPQRNQENGEEPDEQQPQEQGARNEEQKQEQNKQRQAQNESNSEQSNEQENRPQMSQSQDGDETNQDNEAKEQRPILPANISRILNRIQQKDKPAVLFQRMNEREGLETKSPAQKKKKDW
ncbi:MAG: VWA domain-containing protein [Verrucomicrobiota bacterium]